MNRDRDDGPLGRSLRALAAEDAGFGTSAGVREGLLGEVRRLRRARRRATAKTLAFGAALAAVTAVPIWRLASVPAPERTARPAPAAGGVAGREIATEFFPLIYSTVPMSGGRIVRLEVPRAAIASLALEPIPSSDAGAPDVVVADVLVGEDGLARAARFVQMVNTDAQEQSR